MNKETIQLIIRALLSIALIVAIFWRVDWTVGLFSLLVFLRAELIDDVLEKIIGIIKEDDQ